MASINIKWPLVKGTAGAFETNKTTLDAVASDLRILLLTNHGERPGNYEFGANLRHILFNYNLSGNSLVGSDVEQAIRDSVTAAVERTMPFVTIKKISIFPIGSHEVRLKIDFLVSGLEGTLTQSIPA